MIGHISSGLTGKSVHLDQPCPSTLSKTITYSHSKHSLRLYNKTFSLLLIHRFLRIPRSLHIQPSTTSSPLQRVMPSSSQSTSRIRPNPISSRNSRRALRAARSVLPASASLSDLETAINTGAPPQDVEDALADVLHDALTQLHRVRQHEMKLRAFAECGDIVRTYLHSFQL